MRVLMVNTGFLPVPPVKGGSVELHSYYLSNELAKLGVSIDYVTGVNPEADFHNGVTVHKLPWMPFKFHGNYLQTLLSFGIGGCFAFLKASRAISSSKYDIVHIHGHVSGLLLLPLFNKSKFVFTAHNPNPWMVQSFSHFKQSFRQTSFSSIELRIIRKADRVITVGEHLRNELVNRFKIQPEKVEVVYNGVDVDIFRPNLPDPENVLAKYELPPEYVLFVGRLVEQKGVQYLLEAVKGTNIHIVIVGGGPLLSYLRNLCKRLQITQQVHFIGAVPLCDLRKIYSRAQLFVLPSVAEGFPGGLVGLEAMASGLPLIASKIVGIEQLVTDGYNGSLFEIGDTHKLRSKLVQIFNDKALIKKMGKHSRKIAEKHFSWSAVAKRTLQLYQSLIANN